MRSFICCNINSRLLRLQNVLAGLLNLRQIFFATYDMRLHTISTDAEEASLDVNKLWEELRPQITLISQMPGTCPAATFAHIIGGYDAGYYGYLWSQVFSADIYFSKFKELGSES